MELDKNKAIALLGTILFHLSVFLLLFFTVLKPNVPVEDEIVLVEFGTMNASSGTFVPQERAVPVKKTVADPESNPTPSKPAPTAKEEMVTQEMEETIALANRKKEEERKKREEAERKERERLEAERKRKEELQKREQAIRDQVAGAFKPENATDETPVETAGESAAQNNPFRNTGGNTTQSGSDGGMGSFALEGRSIRGEGLPRPAYNVNVEGRIVIAITVDPKGNVLRAEIGKGTTIENATIRNSALNAARQAKFNSIAGANNQSGTITYRYNLK